MRIGLACVALILGNLATLDSAVADELDPEGACMTAPPIGGRGGNSGGDAVFSIPVDVPESASVAPVVKLEYSSRWGSELMGFGWTSMHGAGSVHRCPPTLAQDGYTTKVSYADADRLCLEGSRMVLVEGEYGRDGARYGTEIDSGRLIQQFGDMNATGSRFIVMDEDENISVYDTPLVPIGAPFPLNWSKSVYVDSDGNSIDYLYDTTVPGDLLLTEIRYPGRRTQASKMLGEHFVRLVHGGRRDGVSSFLSGGETRDTRLLSSVQTGSVTEAQGTRLHATYAMHYRTSLANGQMLLHRITGGAYDDDGTYSCRRPVEITWIDPKINYARPVPVGLPDETRVIAAAWSPGSPLPALDRLVPIGDMDVDGRIELLHRPEADDPAVLRFDARGALIDRSELPDDVRLRAESGQRWVGADLLNLGAAQLPGNMDGRFVGLMWGARDTLETVATDIGSTAKSMIIDVNGDNLGDLIEVHREPGRTVVTARVRRPPAPGTLGFDPAVTIFESPGQDDLIVGHEGFLNGNGMVSLVVRRSGAVDRIVDFESQPGGRFVGHVRTPADYRIDPDAFGPDSRFLDVDGDGLRDLVFTGRNGHWHVQMNEDARFAPAIDTGQADPRDAVGRTATLVADVVRDRPEELVYPARRLVDYCIESTQGRLCSAQLAETAPGMDLGIYEYDLVRFRMDPQGLRLPVVVSDTGIISQANRTLVVDVTGSGHESVIGAFDRGMVSGGFPDRSGTLVHCPEGFGCGPLIAHPGVLHADDNRNANVPVVARVQNAATSSHEWTHYPLSSQRKPIYTVPALHSDERFLGADRYYFRSSMYVVGEHVHSTRKRDIKTRYSYGAASYEIQGRGIEGFKWIVAHDVSNRTKSTTWFRQKFPYTGMMERNWHEKESDDENDYLAGSPGKQRLSFNESPMHCYGPRGHRESIRSNCIPHEFPVFLVRRGERPLDVGQESEERP